MKVLFVTTVFPQDMILNVYGIIQRTRVLLDSIQSINADLEILFLTPIGVKTDNKTASKLKNQLAENWGIYCSVVLCERDTKPKENLLQLIINSTRSAVGLSKHPNFIPFMGKRQKRVFSLCMSRSPDIVFFQRIYATGPSLSFPFTGTRIFLDLDDVEHLRFAREIKQPPFWFSKILLFLQVPAIWRDERTSIMRSHQAFVCSDVDRCYLKKVMKVNNVEVIPNSIPKVKAGQLSSSKNVLFIGNGKFEPNRVAVRYLINKVWPILKNKCSMARILVAGPYWEETSTYKNCPNGVEFVGFVDDLSQLYNKTRLLCCPIQSGGGTRIKILEAANYGVPVVSTKLGAEGIELIPEEEIIIKDDINGIAEACANILFDDILAQRLSNAAKKKVRLLYSRETVINKLKKILIDDLKKE